MLSIQAKINFSRTENTFSKTKTSIYKNENIKDILSVRLF